MFHTEQRDPPMGQLMANNDAFRPDQPSPVTSVWTSRRLAYVLHDKRTKRKWQKIMPRQENVSIQMEKFLVSPTASSS